ncbi:putative uracil permease [uncultured Paludibacter sp.]|uniref:Putative uracil permease n=1 Tax=uncultured Paludibacter sp. TaxID=497635 RepID=A0A653AKJ6_9BACT|nr:putative uracil permease [uncultured Paludibacter sp.]
MEKNQRSLFQTILLGIQFMFVAFGATILVPILVTSGVETELAKQGITSFPDTYKHFSPAIALLASGVSTLLFHLVTKGKVPVFLGSSFSFIAPIPIAIVAFGYSNTLSGLMVVGVMYALFGALVKIFGTGFIDKIFPPVVIGPVIMVIGLSLAPVAIGNASQHWGIALITLLTAICTVMYGKGMLKLVPIFTALVVGYSISYFLGLVDTSSILKANWLSLPPVTMPTFDWRAILYIAPVAIAPIVEHVGNIYAIGNVAGKDFIKEPGLHRTMWGDGLGSFMASALGGPPSTTYAEVTGAIQLTKVTDPRVLRISAITAIVVSFIGVLTAVLTSIPKPVLGGIMILLFGMISSIGITTLIKGKVDFMNTKNQIIASVILVIGIGGANVSFGTFQMSGIGLCSIVGVLLNLILPESLEKISLLSKKKV